MAAEGLAGIGSAASEFAKGFLQARLSSAQLAMQQHQQKIEDINTLAQSIDRFKDAPELQATLLGHLNDMVATLPKPPKAQQDQQGGGVVDFFKNMFSGKKKADAPVGPTPPGGTKPPADTLEPRLESPPALPPASTGSQTFGDLSQMFGREVSAPSPAGMSDTVYKYGRDDVGSKGIADTLYKYGRDDGGPGIVPISSGPLNSPPAPTALGPMAQPAATPSAPSAEEFLPRPDQLAQEAISKTIKKIPGAQTSGGVRDQQAESRYVQAMAGAHADTALQSVEHMLAAHPEIKTIGQAYNQLGPEFAHVMDSVQQYENAGMIPKGRLESWQKRFDDVRFGAEKYDSRAVKDGYQHDPVTDKFITPVSDEAKLTDAYSTPADKRTPDQLNRIAGHIEALDQKAKKDPSSLTADERVRSDYYKSLQDKGLVGQPLMDTYQAHAHPLPPTMSTVTGKDPTTGENVIMVLDHRTGKLTPTKIRTAGGTFLPARYQDKIPGPLVKGPTGKDIPGPPVDAFSADRLIAAHSSGDPAVSLDTLADLLKAGAAMSDTDREKLTDYVKTQVNPIQVPPK